LIYVGGAAGTMIDDIPTDSAAAQASSFGALGLCAELLRAVQVAGFERPTGVQQAVIAAALAGRDVLARADTGSGKTAAFGLPLLQRLHADRPERSPRGNPVAVLVLAPTRELVQQIAEVLSDFARHLPTRTRIVAAHGGSSINPQMLALRGGVDLVVATPGRLLDLDRRGALEWSRLRALVLDEGDRLLGAEFRDELTEVLARLPAQRQNLLFSATFPPPLSELARTLLRDPLEVGFASPAPAQEAEPRIEQHAYVVDPERKAALLIELIQRRELQQVLVFVNMKKTADRLTTKLNDANIRAAVFHADKSQHARTQRLREFRAGKLRVLIATDLASRGIDIEALPTVINFELPRSPNDYLHRIGRTGRAGRPGLAISLLCADDEHHFRVIEKRMKQRLPREHVAGFEPRRST
jgi:superfamily II DNA/RNA helicase